MTSCEYARLPALRLVAVILTFTLAMLLCIESSFPQENGETPEEGRQRLERIAEEIAKKVKRHRGGRAGAYGRRPGVITEVPPDALIHPRGQTEDELRMYLLAGVSSGKPYDEMREVLNRPWSRDTVRVLWKLDGRHYERWQSIKGSTLPLLVFAATRYKGDILTEVRSILDQLFSESIKPDSHILGSYGILGTALSKYGTLEVLPDSFWTAVQLESVGTGKVGVLARIGNEDTLKWLEKFQKTCAWENQWTLKTTIEELKKKLAKEKDEERSKPEQTEQPEPGKLPKPENVKNPTTEQSESLSEEGINWLMPCLIIAGLVLAGVVIFLFLRRKKVGQV